MSDTEREIILKGSKIEAGGRSIRLTNIVVRRGVPLPHLGERVVAVNEDEEQVFHGEVTAVDAEKYTYDATIRKFVAPAPSCTQNTRREEVAESREVRSNGVTRRLV